MHDPSLSHSRPRFGCRSGTFSPSCLQIRSIRLWFTTRQIARIGNNLNQLARWANTHKPAAEAIAVIAHLVSVERSLLAVARLDGDGGGAH